MVCVSEHRFIVHAAISLYVSNVTQESPSTTCKKCSKPYTDPRILPCLHSFCKNCIKSLVIQDGSKIPSCKTITSTSIVALFPGLPYLLDQFLITSTQMQKLEAGASTGKLQHQLAHHCFCFTLSPTLWLAKLIWMGQLHLN